MSEGGIDYGGIVAAVIAAAAVVTIVRCLYAAMVAIARCLYAAMIVIARSLYGNTKRQQESFGEHEETEDDEETEEAVNVKWKKSEMKVPFGSAHRESKERHDGGSGSHPRQVDTKEKWKKPESGWVKLNVDGSRIHEEPSAGCGGVIRNERGTWGVGFSQKLDPNICRQPQQIDLQAIEKLVVKEIVTRLLEKMGLELDCKSAVKWKKPESGWVKLNVDGSRFHEEPSAGCGGVIRDEWGTWLVGFSKKLDPNICRQAQQTELQAILTGLKLVWDMTNLEKLVVESDCKSAVTMVESGLGRKYHGPEYKVVRDIIRLLKDPMWLARLDYVPRKANGVADYLAKRASKSSSPHYHLSKYYGPPDYDCKKIFLEENI